MKKQKPKILKMKIIHWNCGDVERAERALMYPKNCKPITNK